MLFMHHFYQYSFSVLGMNRNLENGIPIPDYQIHFVLDRIPYDLKTRSNILE